MKFKDKLRHVMKETGITAAQLSAMTGIGKSSISQYLSGDNEPRKERQRDIAIALGIQEDYFDLFLPPDEVAIQHGRVNLPVTKAAKLMGKSPKWVSKGLQDGVFPWGYAVKTTGWSYFISAIKFEEHTGIKVPYKDEEVVSV